MVTDDALLPLVDLPDDSAAGEHDPTARAGEIRRHARNASKAEYAGEPGRGEGGRQLRAHRIDANGEGAFVPRSRAQPGAACDARRKLVPVRFALKALPGVQGSPGNLAAPLARSAVRRCPARDSALLAAGSRAELLYGVASARAANPHPVVVNQGARRCSVSLTF